MASRRLGDVYEACKHRTPRFLSLKKLLDRQVPAEC